MKKIKSIKTSLRKKNHKKKEKNHVEKYYNNLYKKKLHS
jgi:hypothetical protein